MENKMIEKIKESEDKIKIYKYSCDITIMENDKKEERHTFDFYLSNDTSDISYTVIMDVLVGIDFKNIKKLDFLYNEPNVTMGTKSTRYPLEKQEDMAFFVDALYNKVQNL